MTDYISSSTIDSPPKENSEDKEAEQKQLFEDKKHEEEVKEFVSINRPWEFTYKLILTLKPTQEGSLPITIPVAVGSSDADRIEKMLINRIKAPYFTAILRGIVGEPCDEVQQSLPLEEQNKEGIPGGEDCKPFVNENLLGEPIEDDELTDQDLAPLDHDITDGEGVNPDDETEEQESDSDVELDDNI